MFKLKKKRQKINETHGQFDVQLPVCGETARATVDIMATPDGKIGVSTSLTLLLSADSPERKQLLALKESAATLIEYLDDDVMFTKGELHDIALAFAGQDTTLAHKIRRLSEAR